MNRSCMDCGASLAKRSGTQAKRCLSCAGKPRPKLAETGRRRNGIFTRLFVGGRHVCLDCGQAVPQRNGRASRSLRCEVCACQRYRAMTQLRGFSAATLAAAIKDGKLPRAIGLGCTDCGRPAEAYDHRDYTQPLKVDPVCRSCNVMRGPADVWPDGFDPRPRALISQESAPAAETAKA